MAAVESYPNELQYHPEHDWARIDGDVATFGITWYAQDQLGEVVAVNGAVVDAPETVNDDPYGEGWLVRVRLTDPGEIDALLDVDAYKQHMAEQG